ncbi:MAG TPA: AAA family ATPase [Azospirillum sp.]|nr:AAA family ATPase [Azospirillum sp.]
MLSIRFLGEMEVSRDGKRLELPRSKKTRGLLAYLALAGRPVRRERLCALFWEIPDDPKGALRWSLSRLRPILDEPGRTRIYATREMVAFEPGGARIDLLDVKAQAVTGFDALDIQALAALEREFQGEFLENLELPDCHEFQAWRVAIRDEARAFHARILAALVDRLHGDPEAALPYARGAIRLDPINLTAHHALLRLLVAAGRKEASEEQYKIALRQLQTHGVATAPLVLAWRELRKTTPAPAPLPASDAAPSGPTKDLSVDGEAPGSRAGSSPTPAAGTVERKYVTVLVAAPSEPSAWDYDADPELIFARTEPLLNAVETAVGRFGGIVSSRTGDGITAVFGAPLAHEDDAVRACLAALAARDALGHGPSPGLLGIGLHSGMVVVRMKSDPGSSGVEAVGPVVRIAEQVQRSAAAGMIVLSHETLRRAEGFVQTRPLDALAMGSEPLPTYVLEAQAPLRSRWQIRAARGLSRFVGRQAEVAALRRTLERAGHGRGEVVALVGEPGVGKSRLVHEFLRDAARRGWDIRETSTSPHDSQAFLPVIRLLRDWFEVEDRDSQTAAERVEAMAREWLSDPASHLPAILTLLDLPVADRAWATSSPQRRRHQTIEAVRALIVQRSRRRPLILVVEDLHWLDAQTQSALDAIVEGLGGLPMILLVTFRPGYRHHWSTKTYFSSVRLDPFTEAEAEGFLDAALGPDHSLLGLKRSLALRTEGTPLFLEEAIKALADSGTLVGAPGAYRLADTQGVFDLPSSIQAIIASRIDLLPPRAKALLQVASVIGRDVPVALLRRVAGLDDQDLYASLAELQSAEFLFETRLPPELEYTFKHALTHEVAYSSVLRERRRELHVELVRTIEELFPDNLDEQVDHLARHASAGGLREKAIRYLFRAAEKAIKRSAHLQAADLLKQGLEIIAEAPETPDLLRTELGYQKALGVTMMAARGWGAREVSEAYTRARELSERIGDDRELFVAMRGQGQFHMIRGELDTARAIGERCIALFSGTGDHAVHLETNHLFWSNSFFMGDFERAAAHAARGIATYERDRDHGLTFIYSGHDPGVCCRAFSGLTLWQRGQPDTAVRRCLEALELAEGLSHPLTLALAHWALSYVHLFRREPAEARRWAEMEIAVCERYLLPLLLSQGLFQLGWALAAEGDLAAGIARMEEGLDAIQATGAEMGLPYFIALLGEAYARAGRVREGLRKVDLAQESASRHGANLQQPELLRLRGELLLMGGAPAFHAAEGCFREAMASARAQGAVLPELRATTSLVRLLRHCDPTVNTREILEPLVARLSEGLDTPDVRDARDLLGG